MKRLKFGAGFVVAMFFCPQLALAATPNGEALSIWWGLPFAATLFSIALFPLFMPGFWHKHYGKVIAAWVLAFMVPFGYVFGLGALWENFVHALVGEYIPFILLLWALFVVAGSIYIQSELKATPLVNVGILAVGGLLASVMGTTGASMLLIRPLIRANQHRKNCVPAVIFFILIVSNIGGALTPLGDPPLFLGFLRGVGFFWTTQHLWPQMLFLICSLLLMFFLIDRWMLKKEIASGEPARYISTQPVKRFSIQGKVNFLLLLAVIGLVLLSGVWSSDKVYDVFGTKVPLPGFAREVGLVVVVVVSLLITPKQVRKANHFSWRPIVEVAKIFAGIFLTILPVLEMLRAGAHGPFGPIVAAVTDASGEPIPMMYFGATGILSSFLDNAPTYLVFFNTAGGDVAELTTTLSLTLVAISAGAVFMGANTYLGNAPNLMVKAIAEERGVRMPSFFGYMVWSFSILVPLFVMVTLIWY